IETTAEIAADVFALARPVDEHAEVVSLPAKRLRKRLVAVEPAAALLHLLSLGLILPEIGRGRLRVELRQLALETSLVKLPSARRPRDRRDRRSAGRTRRGSESSRIYRVPWRQPKNISPRVAAAAAHAIQSPVRP